MYLTATTYNPQVWSDSSILTESGFTGHLHNDTLGLIYMNARYYDPYENPATRMYAVQLESGHDYWNGPSYPLVLVRD